MRLFNILVLLFVITLNGVLGDHTRTKRLMYAMCPPNFIGIGSLCYFISDYRVSWLEAQFECKDKNSKLAEPIKLADKKLRRYLQEYDRTRNDIWIGGTFDWQTEKWTWGYSGKDITYNSFGQLNLGSRKDVSYHCAVLDPNMKYRWSARSCVDQHRFICQHKMPRVSEKNRERIYNRWNETYPNQLANEIVLELTGDNYRRVHRVAKGENSRYYYMDGKINRRLVSPDGQRRRRMRPYHHETKITTLSPFTTNEVNFGFGANEIEDPVLQYISRDNRFNNNQANNDQNVVNYEVRQYHRRKKPKTTTETPDTIINETAPKIKPRQKTAFDLELEEKRLKARERRRQERRRIRQQQREQKKREEQERQEQDRLKAEHEAEQKKIQEELELKRKAQLEELENLKRQQLEEQEKLRQQNEIDERRRQELEERRRLEEIEERTRLENEEKKKKEEIEHKRIAEEREQKQREHEEQLAVKRRQHEEWRQNLEEQEKKQKELAIEEERQRLLRQQQQEIKRMEEERKAEERQRREEELARLEKERQLREERQKAREEEIRKRQELLKQQEEEERRLQEEMKQREEEERKTKEEEERRKEEERHRQEEEELRKKTEREEKQRHRKLKQQTTEEESKSTTTESEKSLEDKRRKQQEFRERLAKLSPEQQLLFFKKREERNKRKRIAQKSENEVPIPE